MAGVFTAALRIGLLSASVLAVSLAADEARAATRDADPKAMVLRRSDILSGSVSTRAPTSAISRRQENHRFLSLNIAAGDGSAATKPSIRARRWSG
jgi:hypothetical protein